MLVIWNFCKQGMLSGEFGWQPRKIKCLEDMNKISVHENLNSWHGLSFL